MLIHRSVDVLDGCGMDVGCAGMSGWSSCRRSCCEWEPSEPAEHARRVAVESKYRDPEEFWPRAFHAVVELSGHLRTAPHRQLRRRWTHPWTSALGTIAPCQMAGARVHGAWGGVCRGLRGEGCGGRACACRRAHGAIRGRGPSDAGGVLRLAVVVDHREGQAGPGIRGSV